MMPAPDREQRVARTVFVVSLSDGSGFARIAVADSRLTRAFVRGRA
jgi:hypothetical protein